MGKSKPRNRQRSRQDPTSQATKPPADPELARLREEKILPLLKDFTSADLKTQSSAASAIANLIEDTKTRKLLLREKIVKILLEQTLTDSNLETRTAGWGILRCLASEEEADFCVHLDRQEVLVRIEATAKIVIETIESQDVAFAKLAKHQQTLVWSLTSSLINLLSSLSEAQDEILEKISSIPAISAFLFGLLGFDLSPSEIQLEVLSCLTALTEDNSKFVENIVNHGDLFAGLIHLKNENGPVAVGSCGVLHNIFSVMEWTEFNTPSGASDEVLLPTLIDYIDSPVSSTNGANRASHSTPDQVLQLALEITASIATSLQEALEHGYEKRFEGFGDVEDVEDDDMDAKEDGNVEEDYEMNDDEITAEMEMVTRDRPDDAVKERDAPTLELLVRGAAPAILSLVKSSGASENQAIRDAAISALNNIAWTVSSIDFSVGGLDYIRNIWAPLSQSFWDEIVSPVLASNTADIGLASAITSLAWAVSKSVQGTVKVQDGEPRRFMALYQASRGFGSTSKKQASGSKTTENLDAFQSLGVKCIGVLGTLALNPAPIQLNREIGIFLITALSALPDMPAADATEAMNAVFDIYADKAFAFDEPVFWADGFLKHLEDILPNARKMVKSIDKRKFEELRERANNATLNLARFLKYKKSEKEKVEIFEERSR